MGPETPLLSGRDYAVMADGSGRFSVLEKKLALWTDWDGVSEFDYVR